MNPVMDRLFLELSQVVDPRTKTGREVALQHRIDGLEAILRDLPHRAKTDLAYVYADEPRIKEMASFVYETIAAEIRRASLSPKDTGGEDV